MDLCQSQVFDTSLESQESPCVGVIQFTLNQLGFGPLAEDGHYGPLTEAAVKRFQSARRLSPDGVVGPQTWTALLAPPANAGSQVSGITVIARAPLINVAQHDVSYIAVGLAAPGSTSKPYPAVLTYDTGAFGCLFTQALADHLGLPNLGPISISGVTGSSEAYLSKFDAYVGGQAFPDTPCVVDPGANVDLWGLEFAEANGVSFIWARELGQIIYYRGKISA